MNDLFEEEIRGHHSMRDQAEQALEIDPGDDWAAWVG